MRLPKVENGHTLPAKLKLGAIKLLIGRRAPDVVRTLFYRPEYFGTAFSTLIDGAMCDESRWSRGERELFAAFTSRLNHCPF